MQTLLQLSDRITRLDAARSLPCIFSALNQLDRPLLGRASLSVCLRMVSDAEGWASRFTPAIVCVCGVCEYVGHTSLSTG